MTADPGTFADLNRRYVNSVYCYCNHRLGTREAVEDFIPASARGS